MLGEMIFADKGLSACVPLEAGTWELGGLVPVSLEIVGTSKSFAARALKGTVLEGFGVALELDDCGKGLSTFLAGVGLRRLDCAVYLGNLERSFAHERWTGWSSRNFGSCVNCHFHRGGGGWDSNGVENGLNILYIGKMVS